MKTLPEVVSRSNLGKVAEFLKTGADLNARDSQGRNGLHRAARLGKTDVVQFLAGKAIDVNCCDEHGETALQMACRHGHDDCVKALVQLGANVSHTPPPAKTEYSETALCSAVRYKNRGIVEFLLGQGADCNLASAAKRYPIFFAVEQSDPGLVRLLIRHGADVRVTDGRQNTVLHAAVEAGSTEICQMLLENGAPIDAGDSFGRTAIYLAVQNEHQKLVELLVGQDAGLEIRGRSFKQTPLELAIAKDLPQIKNVLVKAGAAIPTDIEPMEEEILVEVSDEERAQLQQDAPELLTEDGRIKMTSSFEILPEETSSLLEDLERESPPWLENNWRCSEGHLRILRILYKPRDFWAVVYYGRWSEVEGKTNLKDDGTEQIGEPFRVAIDRFLFEGLLRRLSPRETILSIKTVGELKNLARELEVKFSGKKEQLVDRVIEAKLPAGLRDILKKTELLVRTDKVSEFLLNSEAHLRPKFDAEKKAAVFHALLRGDLRTAVIECWSFQKVSRGRWYLAPENCNSAQRILSSKNNIFSGISDKSFCKLKAAICMELLWAGEKMHSWFSDEIKLPSCSMPVDVDLLQNVLENNLCTEEVADQYG